MINDSIWTCHYPYQANGVAAMRAGFYLTSDHETIDRMYRLLRWQELHNIAGSRIGLILNLFVLTNKHAHKHTHHICRSVPLLVNLSLYVFISLCICPLAWISNPLRLFRMIMYDFHLHLTLCGLVTPYCDIEWSQLWLR